MLIEAYDVGTRMGVAIGHPGAIPKSFGLVLKEYDDPQGVAGNNLLDWLGDRWSLQRPDLLIVEQRKKLAGFAAMRNTDASAGMSIGLHFIIETMCCRFGVRRELVSEGTVRKHFIGKGNAGSREATKAAVVKRAQLLNYFEKHKYDEDRADACALWDWAAARFGNRHANLFLFDERVPR